MFMAGEFLNFDTLAEDTIRTLEIPQPSFKKPLCIIFVGFPASGKTTLTNKLRDRFPLAVFSEEVLTSFLSPRATLFHRDSVEVFKLASKIVEHLLKRGKSCIYDANIKTKEQRTLIKRIVQDNDGEFLLVYVNCSKETCYERLQKHNLRVGRGESKGFILDKDYFEYEVSSTSLLSPDEQYVNYNCENPESTYQVASLVEAKLKNQSK
ncbi:MAG: AAA family ATPase [Candidatus Woykebacteria bacterium]